MTTRPGVSRRRFVAFVAGALTSGAGAFLVLIDRLGRTHATVDILTRLERSGSGVGGDASPELVELGRALNRLSPSSSDRAIAAIVRADAGREVGGIIVDAARQDQEHGLVVIQGWLLPDATAGLAGAIAREVDVAELPPGTG